MKVKQLIVGPIRTNCYLIKSTDETAVIDPGGNTGVIVDQLEKLGGRVIYIINTHHHHDHTDANHELKNKTGAKILIHEKEKEFIKFKADQFLHDQDKIGLGNIKLKVIHTPGHSPGSICLLSKENLFTGDTLFKDGFGRTDLAGGSDIEMKKSLEKLKVIIRPSMMVYPGHGEIFKV